jgi:hypothetical protein
MELFLYYVLPNIVLFSSIYVIAKLAEKTVWWFIVNYDDLQEKIGIMLDSRRG